MRGLFCRALATLKETPWWVRNLAPFRAGAKVHGRVGNRAALLKAPTLDERDRCFPGIGATGVETGDARQIDCEELGRWAPNQHMGAVSGSRKSPQLTTAWSKVCKHREVWDLRNQNCSLGKGGLGGQCAQSLSHVQLLVTPWTVAHQPPLSMGFSQQAYQILFWDMSWYERGQNLQERGAEMKDWETKGNLAKPRVRLLLLGSWS